MYLRSVVIVCLTMWVGVSNLYAQSEIMLTASDGVGGDQFGWSVSVSGDLALIGAAGDGSNSGSAYVYRRDGDTWVEEAKLTAPDGTSEDFFGGSVSLSGDYALVGASGNDENGIDSGAAYVYRREGEIWIEEAKLTASDGTRDDQFGVSVSLSGDYALVGVRWDDINGTSSGSAYVYKREGETWVEEAKLTASDGAENDFFGVSVSINGDYALVGAYWDDDKGTNSGSVYVYRRDGDTWVEEAKLTASDGAENDFFGWRVSVLGDHALVGAASDDDNGTDSGSAYMYRRDGETWVEEAKLTASDGAEGDFFGWSVSLSGDHALVGAANDDDKGIDSGSAYVFRRDGETWVEEAKLTASDGAREDFFGRSAALSGYYALVGNQFDDENGNDSGSAYMYDLSTLGDTSVALQNFEIEDHLNEQLDEVNFFKSLYDVSAGLLFTGSDPITTDATLTVNLSNVASVQRVRGNVSGLGNPPEDYWFEFVDETNGSYSHRLRVPMDMGVEPFPAYGLIGLIACMQSEGFLCFIEDPTVLISEMVIPPPFLHVSELEVTRTDGTQQVIETTISLDTWAGSVTKELERLDSLGVDQYYAGMMYSDADVLVTDSQGRRLGLQNGQLYEEIPNAFATGDGEPEGFMIIGTDETYEITIQGTGSGTFDFKFVDGAPIGYQGIPQIVSYENVPVSSSTVARTTMSSTEANRLLEIDSDGDGVFETTVAPTTIVSIEDEHSEPTTIPTGITLFQNYPNPFNQSTTISYALSETTTIKLSVVDVLGREVRVLDQGTRTLGSYEVQFDGSTLPAGLYLYRLNAGEQVITKHLILAK